MEVGLKGDVGRHLWAQVAALISWAVGKVYVAASQGTGSSSCTLSKQSGTKHTGGSHSELSRKTSHLYCQRHKGDQAIVLHHLT